MTEHTLTEEAKQIAGAELLLQKKAALASSDGALAVAKRLAIEIQLRGFTPEVVSEAQAALRRGDRPSWSALLDEANTVDVAELRKEWDIVLAWVDDQEALWVQPAHEREQEILKGLARYKGALGGLIAIFDQAKDLKVPFAGGSAEKAADRLRAAQSSLDDYTKLLESRVHAIEDLTSLIGYLRTTDPPGTLSEVRGTRAEFSERVQDLRNAQRKTKQAVERLSEQCHDSKETIESLIKAMVVAARSWATTEDVRAGTEWAEAILNGVVNVVQVADSEPISATAVQGLHMLIKGACDGVKVVAFSIKAYHLSGESVDTLVKTLKADDFVQFKIAGIKMALSWAAEPLGFIPNVGPFVRAVVNSVVNTIGGIVARAAKKQAEAKESGDTPPTSKEDFEMEIGEVKSAIETAVRDTFTGGAKLIVEENFNAVKELVDVAGGVKSPEDVLPLLITKVVTALAGPAMEEALARIIPSLGMVSPEDIEATLKEARQSVEDIADRSNAMQEVELSFGFDEDLARAKNVDMVEHLGKGESCTVMVAEARSLVTTGGVALLIGDDHSENNLAFVDALSRSGTLLVGSLTSDGGVLRIAFSESPDDARKLVETYMRYAPITKKKLAFGGDVASTSPGASAIGVLNALWAKRTVINEKVELADADARSMDELVAEIEQHADKFKSLQTFFSDASGKLGEGVSNVGSTRLGEYRKELEQDGDELKGYQGQLEERRKRLDELTHEVAETIATSKELLSNDALEDQDDVRAKVRSGNLGLGPLREIDRSAGAVIGAFDDLHESVEGAVRLARRSLDDVRNSVKQALVRASSLKQIRGRHEDNKRIGQVNDAADAMLKEWERAGGR